MTTAKKATKKAAAPKKAAVLTVRNISDSIVSLASGHLMKGYRGIATESEYKRLKGQVEKV